MGFYYSSIGLLAFALSASGYLYRQWDVLEKENTRLKRQLSSLSQDSLSFMAAQNEVVEQFKSLEAQSEKLIDLALNDRHREQVKTLRSLYASSFKDDEENTLATIPLLQEGKESSFHGVAERLSSAQQNFAIMRGRLLDLNQTISVGHDFVNAIPTLVPSEGRITSHFGRRKSPINGRESTHKGIDIAGPEGAPIVSSADGVVMYSGTNGNYGRFVVITHGYVIKTRYAHCQNVFVKVGQRVARGQRIASIGKTGRVTGAHLHYEVLLRHRIIDPVPFMKEQYNTKRAPILEAANGLQPHSIDEEFGPLDAEEDAMMTVIRKKNQQLNQDTYGIKKFWRRHGYMLTLSLMISGLVALLFALAKHTCHRKGNIIFRLLDRMISR